MMHKLSILSYNLLFSKGLSHALKLIKKHSPDVVCLQEFEITLDNIQKVEKQGYYLADYSHSFFRFFKFYGVATFYNPHTVEPEDGGVIALPRSFYEFLLILFPLINRKRTVLKTSFLHKASKKPFEIYNLHLTMFGLNGARIRQLKVVLKETSESKHSRLIIAGDYNYAYRRRVLEDALHSYMLKEATDSIYYTIKSWFGIKVKIDYVFYKGLEKISAERIEEKNSDHYPILIVFSI